jgi:hypothetical protein
LIAKLHVFGILEVKLAPTKAFKMALKALSKDYKIDSSNVQFGIHLKK